MLLDNVYPLVISVWLILNYVELLIDVVSFNEQAVELKLRGRFADDIMVSFIWEVPLVVRDMTSIKNI